MIFVDGRWNQRNATMARSSPFDQLLPYAFCSHPIVTRMRSERDYGTQLLVSYVAGRMQHCWPIDICILQLDQVDICHQYSRIDAK